MEFKKDKLKEIFVSLFDHIKTLDSELTAHRLAVLGLSHNAGLDQEQIDLMLKTIRNDPAFVKDIRERIEIPMEIFLNTFDKGAEHQEFFEMLQKWKPKGPAN